MMRPGVAVGSIAVAGAAAALAVLVSRSPSALVHVGAPAVLALVAVWMFFSERYEWTLAVLALYLGLLDGFLKLKTGSTVATLGRDVLLYAIAGGALVRLFIRGRPIELPRLSGAVLLWVVICVAQVFNPVEPSILHAAAGLRQHLEFVPLFFLGYAVMRSERRIMGMCVLLVAVAAINGIVALAQEQMSLAQLASWGPGYAKQVYGSGTFAARTFSTATGVHIRPPALGSDFGFGGLVGMLAAPAVLAIGSAMHTRWRLVLAGIGAPLVVLAIVTSQARLSVACAVVATVTYLLLTITTKKGVRTLALAVILGALAYAAVPAIFPAATSGPNRYASLEPTQLVSTTLTDRGSSLALLPGDILAYPLGDGIGTTGPASGSAFGGVPTVHNNAETEFNFLIVEVGLPGLILLTVLTGRVIASGIRLRRLPNVGVQRGLMALVAANVAMGVAWIIAPMTANSPTSPFFWFTAGAIVYWTTRPSHGMD